MSLAFAWWKRRQLRRQHFSNRVIWYVKMEFHLVGAAVVFWPPAANLSGFEFWENQPHRAPTACGRLSKGENDTASLVSTCVPSSCILHSLFTFYSHHSLPPSIKHTDSHLAEVWAPSSWASICVTPKSDLDPSVYFSDSVNQGHGCQSQACWGGSTHANILDTKAVVFQDLWS